MGNFAVIFLCLFLGWIFKKLDIFPKDSARFFNRFVIYLSLPALTIRELHKLNFNNVQTWITLMPWLLFLLALLFFFAVSRQLKISKPTLGALILTAGLGNTSFVGFPLLEWLFGPHALGTGILVDQGGSFLAAGTLGILVAQFFSGKALSLQVAAKRVFSFPPFLAVLASIPLHFIEFPASFDFVLDRLANTLVPLALFSVGLQWELNARVLKEEKNNLILGLGFKLFFAPLFFLILYAYVFKLRGEALEIVLLESAMAPMITAGVIAVENGLKAQTANTMIGLGIPLSLITVPLWKLLISGILH